MINIRSTIEVVTHLNKRNEPGLVVQIDFEKCFDRVEFESIRKVFKYFGFGDNFVQMLSLLFTDLILCTTNNGFISKCFVKGRGCNRGCPASPQIFLYCSETMTHLLQQDHHINGLDVGGIKRLLSQFADDTSAYLKFEKLCVDAFTETLMCVESQLGLKVSYEKTTIYRVGSLCNSDAILYTQKNLKWSNEAIETLGVDINCDGSIPSSNYDKIIVKMKRTMENWYNRTLTLHGKVLVINSLIGSLFVYKVTAMLTLNDTQINQINKMIRDFLWKGGKAKIALETLMKLKEQGGLKLVDITAKQYTCKIAWVFKVENDPFLLECMYCSIAPILRQDIWKCNLSTEYIRKHWDTDNFWVSVLLS